MESSSDLSIVESASFDFLICKICSKVLSEPRILPCLHTYCFRCICTHTESAKSNGRPATCPQCQELLHDDVSSLPVNVLFDGLAEVKKYKESQDSCVPCKLRQTVSSTAEMICLNCGDLLCTACGNGHNSSSLTVGHRIVSLVDLKHGKYEREIRQMKKIKCQCSQHSDVQFYCQSCFRLVCMACVLIGHRDHSLQEISEAAVFCKSRITSLVENTRKNVSKLSSRETSFLNRMETINTEHEKQKSLIKEKAKREIAKIHAEECKALEALEAKTETVQRVCKTKLDKVSFQKGLVNNCISFCDSVLQKGNDDEILMLESVISKRLQLLRGREAGLGKEEGEEDDVGVKETRDPTNKTDLKTLKLRTTFTVQTPADSLDPDIRGFAYNPQIGLLVADKANGCIKSFTGRGGLLDRISFLDFQPTAVTICKNIIAAVSENILYLLSESGALLKRTMLHDKKPNEQHTFTYAVAAHERESYLIAANIPDDARLHCYGLDGKLRCYISGAITFPVSSISVTPNDCLLVCEWKAARVRLLTMEGMFLCDYDPGVKWRPSTVFTAEGGFGFVIDYRGKGSRVWGFDELGICQLVYRPDSDGLVKMSYLAGNANGNLYILDRKGKLCVYDIADQKSE